MKLILGSQSPRRKEILSYFNLPFQQAIPSFQEDEVTFNGNPEEFVLNIASGKSKSLRPLYSKSLILTADSIVYCDDKVFGKPANRKQAYEMIETLQGKWHSVFTGIVIQDAKQCEQRVEETRVRFNTLNEAQIKQYLSTQKWSDKAAGYAIQTSGGLIVNKIEGCYYNVMGLPINTVRKSLQTFGIELWDYLK